MRDCGPTLFRSSVSPQSCGMTSFGIYKPIYEQNASAFDSAFMNIWLRFGFSYTIMIYKDSKFLAVFLRLPHFLTSTLMSYPVKIMIQ